MTVLRGFSRGQFVNGGLLTITISGISGLAATDFDYLSEAGGNGSYASAVHVRSIDPGDMSGWGNPTSTFLSLDTRQPSVPDGSTTVVLLGVSLLVIEGLRRRGRSFTA